MELAVQCSNATILAHWPDTHGHTLKNTHKFFYSFLLWIHRLFLFFSLIWLTDGQYCTATQPYYTLTNTHTRWRCHKLVLENCNVNLVREKKRGGIAVSGKDDSGEKSFLYQQQKANAEALQVLPPRASGHVAVCGTLQKPKVSWWLSHD